jgi:LacI family transcriptional regulator
MVDGAVTLKHVASRAGISVATVSHVLNGTRHVKNETRERVLAAVNELGYAGHSIARSLRRGRTAILGLVVSDIENPFFASLASHVQRAASSQGYQVIFSDSKESPEREREIVDALSSQRVDGIILAPVAPQNVELLSTRRTPMVLVNRRVPSVPTPYVVADDQLGASLGFDHLWDLGHRVIVVVHNGINRSTTVERIEGVRASYARRGMVFDETLSIDAGPSSNQGEAALVKLLSRKTRKPTAILALGNWALLSAIRGLHASRLRCPEDISLVGYGVTSPYWMPSASISMVELPVGQMAHAAVDLCLSQIEKADHTASVMLPPAFTAGESSAPLHASPGTAAGRTKRAGASQAQEEKA